VLEIGGKQEKYSKTHTWISFDPILVLGKATVSSSCQLIHSKRNNYNN